MPTCAACGSELPDRAALHGRDRLHGLPGAFEVRVCPACGSGRTFPLVPEAELGGLYPSDYRAYALPQGRVARRLATALYRRRYRRSLARGPLQSVRRLPPGRLLDVGAGRGDLGVVLQERGWRVTGLEPSAEACAEGAARGVEMVQGTLTDAQPGEGFDAVVFEHSLEHVVVPREDLARARELLRPGGLVVVAVPNFGSRQARRFGDAWFHLDLPRHRTHFTPRGLDLVLRESGFDAVELGTSTTPDGLPNSVQYRLFGRRRGSYVLTALSLALLPLTAALAGGDELYASAVRR